ETGQFRCSTTTVLRERRRFSGSRATLNAVKPAAPNPIPTAETPALTDEERVRRLRLLAERLRNPDGLDRGTLARIEQLTGDLEYSTRCGDGHHRIPPADALIAAAAAEHGGLAVLHRDAHFDRLATVLHFQSVPLPGP